MLYEILLRGDESGNLKGAHVLETATSLARPIKAGEWPAIIAGINEAALTKAAAYDEAVAAKYEAVAAQEAAAKSLAENQAISDQIAIAAEAITEHPELSDAQKVTAIRQLVPQARLFGKSREKAKLEAEVAAKLAEAEALAAKAAAL